jgi:hypothetical protein
MDGINRLLRVHVGGNIECRPADQYARIVHENIEPTLDTQQFSRRRLYTFVVRNIKSQRDNVEPFIYQASRGLFTASSVAASEINRHSMLSKLAYNLFAKTFISLVTSATCLSIFDSLLGPL